MLNDTALELTVSSHFKSLSLEFGRCDALDDADDDCAWSSFKHSMLIFVGDLAPELNDSDALYFAAGVHNISESGAANGGVLSTSASTIYFERGAFVFGKLVCVGDGTQSEHNACSVRGYGILSGARFSFVDRFRDEDDYRAMINATRFRAARVFQNIARQPISASD